MRPRRTRRGFKCDEILDGRAVPDLPAGSDIYELFSREKINVIGVNTQSAKGQARMTFAAEIGSTAQLQKALLAIHDVGGVQEARRQ